MPNSNSGPVEPRRRVLAEWATIGGFLVTVIGLILGLEIAQRRPDSPPRAPTASRPPVEFDGEGQGSKAGAAALQPAVNDSLALADDLTGKWAPDGYTCAEAMTLEVRDRNLDVFARDGSLVRSLEILSRRGAQLITRDSGSTVVFRLQSTKLHYAEGALSKWFERCD